MPFPVRAAAAVLLVALAARADAQPVRQFAEPAAPKVVELGHGRYRVGRVKLDRPHARLWARGTVLRDAPPLEYLAVGRKGDKSYEALVELAAEPIEFNLACILLGLDAAHARVAERHFDPEPVTGDRVRVTVAWRTPEGTVRRVDAADLVALGDATLARGEWIYTGSTFFPDGRYAAQAEGPIVGFVHDPAPIIEHRTGLRGHFDDAGPNTKLAPPGATRVTRMVAR